MHRRSTQCQCRPIRQTTQNASPGLHRPTSTTTSSASRPRPATRTTSRSTTATVQRVARRTSRQAATRSRSSPPVLGRSRSRRHLRALGKTLVRRVNEGRTGPVTSSLIGERGDAAARATPSLGSKGNGRSLREPVPTLRRNYDLRHAVFNGLSDGP